MKQRCAESLQTTSLYYFNAKYCILLSSLRKPNTKFHFCSSLFFLSFFFATHTCVTKNFVVCANIKKYGNTFQLGMGKVENGRLYIRYRSSSQKMKQRSSKSLQTASLCYSNAKSTLLVLLTFNRVEKTKHKNFNFVHIFLFFIHRRNSKSVCCVRILNIPNNCFANLLHSYLF